MNPMTNFSIPTPIFYVGVILTVVFVAYAAAVTYLGCRNERTLRVLAKENERLRKLLHETSLNERP